MSTLARTESVPLGNRLMELAQAGNLKGNYEWRLNKALDAIERHRAQERRGAIQPTEDQSEYLRELYDNTGKLNAHNMGML